MTHQGQIENKNGSCYELKDSLYLIGNLGYKDSWVRTFEGFNFHAFHSALRSWTPFGPLNP